MTKVLEQRPVREIGHSFVAAEQNLDVAEGFSYHHVHDFIFLQVIDEVSVERVEVVLNTGPLHHQILRHPRQVIIRDTVFQFTTLQTGTIPG